MTSDIAALDRQLLNDWQQRFPLCSRPFDSLADALHCEPALVLQRLQALQGDGSLSRIGGIWNPGAGGAALLCAMAVPAPRLEAVAVLVSAHAGVNHNYEREHAYNLWFVMTGVDAAAVEQGVQTLERQCGLQVLRLPMQRAYRINLGFDLAPVESGNAAAGQRTSRPTARPAPQHAEGRTRSQAVPVSAAHRGLAALLEQGLPLQAEPYARWAETLGWSEGEVLACLQQWLEQGSLRRFGMIVRHHELGYRANAMCVFDVDDHEVDARAAVLAQQAGVTLCYRRARGPGWPYNLYCMMHGREREQVLQSLALATRAAGLDACSRAVLFSRRRFKQCGASYFRSTDSAAAQEGQHAAA